MSSRTVCLAYVRKSMVRKGASDPAAPDIQRTRIAGKLAPLGYDVEWFEDVEGHSSGLTAERQAWQRLLARLGAPEVAAVAVDTWDKAARNVKLLLQLVDDCDRLRVRFISANDQIDTSTADGRFQLTILAAVAEHYARRTGERRAESIDYLRRHKGRHYGLAPFGSMRVAAAGDLVLVPSNQAQPNGTDHDALRAVYESYVRERQGFRRVAVQLNEAGWRYRDRAGQLRPWTRDDVRRVLASHWLYAGYVTVGRAHRNQTEILPGSHAPLLPEGLLAPVALRFESSHKLGARRRPPYDYPLSGLLHCVCGQALKGAFSMEARRYMHEFKCPAGRPWYIRADELEFSAREHLAGLRLPDAVTAVSDAALLRWLMAEQGGGQSDGERRRLEQAIERLAELYADGEITRDHYARKKAEYQAQLPAPATMSADMAAPGPVAGLPPVAEAARTASAPMLRDMLRALYERITVQDGELVFLPLPWCQGWA